MVWDYRVIHIVSLKHSGSFHKRGPKESAVVVHTQRIGKVIAQSLYRHLMGYFEAIAWYMGSIDDKRFLRFLVLKEGKIAYILPLVLR